MNLRKPIVDHKAAEHNLRTAISLAQDEPHKIPVTEWNSAIRAIIQGTHLTFRYILVTALLGKSTNPSVNTLALQSGADIEGAYDARSLCHGVVVPIERQLLNRALGGSNEPFLNKPARFPMISILNAVRAGRDRELLVILHTLLSEIETSDQAFHALCVAMQYALGRQTAQSRLFPTLSESTDSHLKIFELIEACLVRSIEGQIAAIIAGTVLSIYFEQFEFFEVITHPVNQSGASSNEVADIDIKKDDKIFVAVEVKDKNFSKQDVDHAAFKASQYGLSSITFILGRQGKYIGSSLESVAKEVLAERNINVIFIDIIPFAKSVLALCPAVSLSLFLEKLQHCAIRARAKDEVFEHIQKICIP